MWRQVAVIMACIGATAAVAAQPSTPYKAYVVVEEAYIRSGPGEGFYPTEKVRFGREVEVYQRDAAGWCAIRPLEESFSWVPAWDLRMGEDGLAEVASDNVAARVGSQFSDVRDVVQVRLKRGELVEVLGWKRMGTGAETQTWYRIAPPSGEFRWIHERFLDVHPPQARLVRTAEAPAVASESGGVRQAVALQPAQGPPNSPAAASAPAPHSTTSAHAPSDPSTAASGQASSAAGAQPSAAKVPVPQNAVPSEEFQAELDDINTELSLMLAEEPSVWNCDELIRRTESLLSVAQTASQRAHARLLLNRLARAAQVKKRFDAVYSHASTPPAVFGAQAVVQALRNETPPNAASPAQSSLGAGAAPPPLLPPQTAAPLPAEGPARGHDLYDGVGKLTRVMPGKVGGPRYALLDERGRVAWYVTPAPGVGLQHYVGRRVAITGSRDPLPDLNVPHLTARHVTPLEGAYRR